jgi:oxygen-dependent protoporphyrinogen oxidase
MGMALPTRLRPFLTTDLFTPAEKLRMGLDLLLPRDSRSGDLSVGDFLERRLGRALVDRLAGPLIGGVYGTPVDQLSLDAVVPTLRASERNHRSLLLASLADGRARAAAVRATQSTAERDGPSRPSSAPTSPFAAMARGTGQLIEALAAALRDLAAVEIRMAAPVSGLERAAAGVSVRIRGGETVHAGAAIIATEGPASADLVAGVVPGAAEPIRAIPHVTTIVVNLAFAGQDVPERITGHGFLVADDEPLSISACTLSSRKWAGRAPDGMLLARAFIRPNGGDAPADDPAMTDAALVSLAQRDIAATLGIRGAPRLTRVSRFVGIMPQYTVGHLERTTRAEAALAKALPNVRLAGSALHGAGLPDCIAQGDAAAEALKATLSGGRFAP